MSIEPGSDIIDVREVTDRYEELEAIEERDEEEAEEHARLKSLLDELEGNGGDHDWRGSWYPLTLIRDSYFEEYARDLAEDIGYNRSDEWPGRHIDWEAAADELKHNDYTSFDYEGTTYWYR